MRNKNKPKDMSNAYTHDHQHRIKQSARDNMLDAINAKQCNKTTPNRRLTTCPGPTMCANDHKASPYKYWNRLGRICMVSDDEHNIHKHQTKTYPAPRRTNKIYAGGQQYTMNSQEKQWDNERNLQASQRMICDLR
jgi:hypothetical protein